MKIYKKDTKGNIRFLHVFTADDILFQESGLLSGKVITTSKRCTSKNIGKANETTPEKQANIQKIALITIKLTEGYFETVEEAQNEEVILPMLAKSYDKEKHKIDWEGDVFVQPKFDGMRCLAFIKDGKVELRSRKGKLIETMRHIEEELINMVDGVILDGELYCHGESFQENMKMIKKYRKGESEKVKFHIYDCIENNTFGSRYMSGTTQGGLSLVRTIKIYSEEELKEYHSAFLADGYEGTMIRHGYDSYKVNGRSSQLLKYKDFIDKTYKVVDVIPSEARPEQGVLVLDGFKASLKMSFAEREEILANKECFIGETAEIRFFEYTDDGLPRFPVCVGFRLDK